MLPTTEVLLLSGGHQLSFVVKKMYRPLWYREQCKTQDKKTHSLTCFQKNVNKIGKQMETPDAASNALGLDDQ